MGNEITLTHAEPTFACGRRGSLVLMVWRGNPTWECLQRAFDLLAHASEDVGGKVGVIGLIESGSPPPPIGLFPAVARHLDALAGLIATAAVLEDRSALGIHVLDGMGRVVQLARRKHPTRVCADVAEAASWMAPRLGVGAADAFRREAVELAEHVRASLDAA